MARSGPRASASLPRHRPRAVGTGGVVLAAAGSRLTDGAAKTLRGRGPPTATFPEAVPESEEVVPVNAVLPWVLPSGVTVGR